MSVPLARSLAAAIGWFFDLPAAAVIWCCIGLALFCLLVLPLAIGVPLVALAASLPWWEDWLMRRGRDA
jgi:hypothetical protein